jgi:hypothetical protein
MRYETMSRITSNIHRPFCILHSSFGIWRKRLAALLPRRWNRIAAVAFGVSIPLRPYRPAPRLGTRRVENRLLRRLAGSVFAHPAGADHGEGTSRMKFQC